jgi:hypothetical protein
MRCCLFIRALSRPPLHAVKPSFPPSAPCPKPRS